MKTPTPRMIKMARTAANLSQARAAALVGYTRYAWCRWEAGNREMKAEVLALFKQRAKREFI